MVLPPLAMTEDHELGAGIGNHGCIDVASVRAFGSGMAILRADADLFGLFMHRVDQRVRRGNGDFDLHVALRCTVDGACFGKHGARAVHFPVSDDVGPFGHV